MPHRQAVTQAMQWQPRRDVLADKRWGAMMGWTPTFSVTPNLKMEWNCMFQLWHAHTHTHMPAHILHTQLTGISLYSQSWVCVTQFGLCVRGSSAFGSSYLFLPCFLSDSFPFFLQVEKKKAHQSVAETLERSKPKGQGIFFTPHTYWPGSWNKILFGSPSCTSYYSDFTYSTARSSIQSDDPKLWPTAEFTLLH